MIIDTTVLWAFTLLWLVIVPTPGANSLFVTHVAMTRPAGHLALAIAGNVTGIVLLAVCALLGWAAVLQAFPWLRLAVNIAGALYLVYFGLRLLAKSFAPAPAAEAGSAEHRGEASAMRRTFALGFATALSNTQAIVFITSIYAVTGILDASLATGFSSIAIIIVCNATYLALLGWLFKRPAVRNFYQRFRRWIEGVVGSLFILFGGRLLVRELVS
jgi:threonine efflux protein